jgi:hypothetical protein
MPESKGEQMEVSEQQRQLGIALSQLVDQERRIARLENEQQGQMAINTMLIESIKKLEDEAFTSKVYVNTLTDRVNYLIETLDSYGITRPLSAEKGQQNQ